MSDLVETMPGANTAPPILLLQGTGGTNAEMLTFGRRLAPQSPLITIAGRQGEGPQRQYFRQTVSTPADPHQILTEAQWIAAQVRQVCAAHRWDVANLITVGYSNGAAMGAYGIRCGLIPGHLAVLLHPLWVPVPATATKKDETRKIWFSAGKRDQLVSVETVKKVAQACADLGAQTTVETTLGSHQLTPQEVLAAHDWLAAEIAES